MDPFASFLVLLVLLSTSLLMFLGRRDGIYPDEQHGTQGAHNRTRPTRAVAEEYGKFGVIQEEWKKMFTENIKESI